ncbi:MAG TPA: serine/threonine-protein kinase, partial [Acidobacteriota bacterium]|nr:serine/threonine-protein kinase [Acidobacteriota bacterium]
MRETLGNYRIVQKIGVGGMGEVYEAKDSIHDRTVALKIMNEKMASDPKSASRFMREAQAASILNHPGIAQIYEVGESEGTKFIAMEFVEGESLESRLANGPLPLSELIHLAIQLVDAFGEAHSKHVIHRDIKPANIMITKRGDAKILDFGLAKVLLKDGDKNALFQITTDTNIVIGTIQYMSPEQALGGAIDPRSDIFSLGAVLYEMATGRRAFNGKTYKEVALSIIGQQPEAIGHFNNEFPEQLEKIIFKCLCKKPADRYQTDQDL